LTKTIGVGFVNDKVILVVEGITLAMTPKTARIYADLMVHAADWIDPVVVEPPDEPE
jgi:hypothetical protein